MNYLELRRECNADPEFFKFVLDYGDKEEFGEALSGEWGVELSAGVAEAVRRDLANNQDLKDATLQLLALSVAPGPCQIRWPRFHAIPPVV